ncbi:hypothetical protein AB1N83_012772 [Pleurotus pulmonarius]
MNHSAAGTKFQVHGGIHPCHGADARAMYWGLLLIASSPDVALVASPLCAVLANVGASPTWPSRRVRCRVDRGMNHSAAGTKLQVHGESTHVMMLLPVPCAGARRAVIQSKSSAVSCVRVIPSRLLTLPQFVAPTPLRPHPLVRRIKRPA